MSLAHLTLKKLRIKKNTSQLKVIAAEYGDVFQDIARFDQSHRNNIPAGSLCKLTTNGQKIVIIARGKKRKNDRNTIALDDDLRTKLQLVLNKEYSFEIEEASFWDQFLWAWSASNPTHRTSSQLALLSLALAILSILLSTNLDTIIDITKSAVYTLFSCIT